MKIYDYYLGDLVEISDAQYDFLAIVVKHIGRLAPALKEYPVSNELLAQWKADKVYWSVLEGHVTVMVRAHGVTPEYIKSYLLETLEGKKAPTPAQMQAINASTRILGLGLAPRTKFSGHMAAQQGEMTITFDDGLDDPPLTVKI